MERRTGRLAFIATSFLMVGNASADTVIRFSPGPDFSTSISTPWGNFIAVDNGSSIWIGTEAEYVNAKAQGILRSECYRELRVAGEASNVHHMVSSKRPSTMIGKIQLADIEAAICFQCKPGGDLKLPVKDAHSKYVEFMWAQSGPQKTDAYFLDSNKKAYKPVECFTMDIGGRRCTFVLPDSAAGGPGTIVFLLNSNKPSALNIESVAQLRYADLRDSNAEMRNSGAHLSWSAEDRQELKALHGLDATIPDTAP